jgi:acetyl-CoA carboxylase carboxyl transferase subunit beta
MRNLKELVLRQEAAPDAPAQPAPETCLSCNADLTGSRAYERYRVCHSCGHHFVLGARERVAMLLDHGSFREADRGVTNIDPISFSTSRQSYRQRVIGAQRRTGLAEAALTGTGMLFGREMVVAALDFSFLGGSIGVVAGERLARAFEKAVSRRAPMISVCSTSGTRMQEGILALLQVPRVATAALKLADAGLPHVAILTDPTTGSAYSAFVGLADYVIAEPNALVGYAAMRVLAEESGHDLPQAAHTAEEHLAHGLIDAIVPRANLRESVAALMDILLSDYHLTGPARAREPRGPHTPHAAMEQVNLSRHAGRPTSADLARRMASALVQIKGDRSGRDDPAVFAAFASLSGEPVTIVAHDRPHEPGQPTPFMTAAGFRKAARAIRLAGKFGLPVVTLIDTPGAHPGIDEEDAGLGAAIAQCLTAMLHAPVPTVAAITGEGSSEAAVALACADRVLMLDNAVYEVVRPEHAARALAEDPAQTGAVAERLRMTSHDCLRLHIADGTVAEPGEGAHTDHQEAAVLLRRAVVRELTRLEDLRPRTRLVRRYERYRHMGDTRARLRGTLERRLAHLFDRMGAAWDRMRGRARTRLRSDGAGSWDIPL